MHDELIRWHISRLAKGLAQEDPRLIAATRDCWPGGPADRTEPAARDWLRLWHPAQALTPLPACSCAVGHCGVCN
jgi:hypothetical protein